MVVRLHSAKMHSANINSTVNGFNIVSVLWLSTPAGTPVKSKPSPWPIVMLGGGGQSIV